jgi:acyl-CoA thioester hydrolase
MTDFTWPVRVYYEDTDAGGVVYYANYLKFLERARTEWLRGKGFEQDRLREETGILFVVRSLRIDYLKPARFNERLEVTVRLSQAGKASLEVAQAILGPQRAILCSAEVKLACVHSQTFRPCKLPDPLLTALT